jgi:hypothetical protein
MYGHTEQMPSSFYDVNVGSNLFAFVLITPSLKVLLREEIKHLRKIILAQQNGHDSSPFLSCFLRHFAVSINTSLFYSTRKTPFNVVFCRSIVSSP